MVANISTSAANRRAIAKDYSLAKRKLNAENDSFRSQQKLELDNYERELRNSTQRDSRALGSPRDRNEDPLKEQLKAFKDEQKRKLEIFKTSSAVGEVQAKQKLLDAQYGAFSQGSDSIGQKFNDLDPAEISFLRQEIIKERAQAKSDWIGGRISGKQYRDIDRNLRPKLQYITLSSRNKAKINIIEGMDKAEAYSMYGFNVEAQRARDQAARKVANKEQRLAAGELRREQRPELKAAEEKARRLAATAGMTEEQKAQRMTDINNEKIKSGLMGQSGVALSSQAQRDEQNFMDSQPMLTNYADRSRAFGAYQRSGLTFDESYSNAFGNSYSPKSGSGVLYANEGGSVTKPLDFRKGGFVPVKDKNK